VVEATGLERFSLFGVSQGAAVAAAYAARHPERVSALVLHGGYAVGWRSWRAPTTQVTEALMTLMAISWGSDSVAYRSAFSSLFLPQGPESGIDWLTRLQKESASPRTAVRFMESFGVLDVRDELPRVRVPTLISHAAHDQLVPFSQSRIMAGLIPEAELLRLDSCNHLLLESEPAWSVWTDAFWSFLERAGA
jgi:pimeloyl-ACP methyl ester carboxylesterase